jgi:hypothetical protein
MLQVDKNMYEHVTRKESECPCGCGLVANKFTLTMADAYIQRLGSPTRITCLPRCERYNKKIGGFSKSAHLQQEGYGAGDFAYGDSNKRTRMILTAIEWFNAKLINNVEICDKHIHLGLVPEGHILFNVVQGGVSK